MIRQLLYADVILCHRMSAARPSLCVDRVSTVSIEINTHTFYNFDIELRVQCLFQPGEG